MVRTVFWRGEYLEVLDQSRLPYEEKWIKLRSYQEVVKIIRDMKIRGAPLIGVVAAFGVVLASKQYEGNRLEELRKTVLRAVEELKNTRPTGRNLFWSLDRVLRSADDSESIEEYRERLEDTAVRIMEEDVECNRRIGEYGIEIVNEEEVILTHCNTGLGTVDYGTALGVIRTAWRRGLDIEVIATETRPKLQGARLTAWELKKEGIPFRLITDSMVGYVMKEGLVDKVIVGADRILLNGDVANKIGTLTIAIVAQRYGVPFYVAAPVSTIDPKSSEIPIEFRDEIEVLECMGVRTAPEGCRALNPAFDVTDNSLITGIITDRGIAYPPYLESLQKILREC